MQQPKNPREKGHTGPGKAHSRSSMWLSRHVWLIVVALVIPVLFKYFLLIRELEMTLWSANKHGYGSVLWYDFTSRNGTRFLVLRLDPAPRKPQFFMALDGGSDTSPSLEFDFYRDSCPPAEKIVRDMVRDMHRVKPSVGPALLRLMFHDCFIEGCDASVLLDPANGMDSEKESLPNRALKGFDAIDIIKSELERVCPGVVSCADIVVLAAREAVVANGGPFYPLYTGRRDSLIAFQDIAAFELPSPQGDLSETLASFMSRGFNERETVSLLGAHSIGTIHCRFFRDRLYNFSGTGLPDPSLDPQFLEELRSKCGQTPSPASAPSPSSPPESPSDPGIRSTPGAPTHPPPKADVYDPGPGNADEGVDASYQEANGAAFGTQYYRSLLQSRGILRADQQLLAGEETGIWVRAYASDPALFRRDFAVAMMKLSNLNVLTGPLGQVRFNCSRVG